MTGQPTLLAVLLEDKGLHRYGTFRAAYEKAARSLDRHLDGSAPSRAQFHRWLTGDLRRLPYTDHCRVLEQMLTGYSAGQLFQPTPDGGTPAPARGAPGPVPGSGQKPTTAAGMADVAAVFASRSDFAANVEPRALFDGASRIRAAGLSLNLICQQVPDQHLRRMLADGAQLTCLFLDPGGEAIKAREREEEHPAGHLAGWTRLNIEVMSRHRDRLPAEARDRLRLAVYDETIRFNIVLVDDRACVVQPYLPRARGIDSPTLLIRPNGVPGGLYPVFEQVYDTMAERSRQI
jgi:Domain of unknown function (DUF5919)